MTDGVLVVEQTRLHISKALLANHSTFFKSLFFSNFKEREQEVDNLLSGVPYVSGFFDLAKESVFHHFPPF